MLRKLVFILTIALSISSCNSQKKEPEEKLPKDVVQESEQQKVIVDSIINFPNGNRIWIALKTTDQEKVASIIGLEEYEQTNWQTGFNKIGRKNKFDSRIFITPVINNEWIIVTGYDLPAITSRDFETFANELSSTFGHFSYYYMFKDTFGVAKATDGKLERLVYYNNNSDIIEKGNKTKAEKNIKLTGQLKQFKFSEKLTKAYKKEPTSFKGLHSDIEYEVGFDNDIYVAYYIPWPNRDYMFKIAEQWSINPRLFTENGDISEGLGLLGKTNYKYSN